jgi:hypothetical protein
MTSFEKLTSIPVTPRGSADSLDDYASFKRELLDRVVHTKCVVPFPNLIDSMMISKADFKGLNHVQRRMLMVCATQAAFSHLLANNGQAVQQVRSPKLTKELLMRNVPSLGDFLQTELKAIGAPDQTLVKINEAAPKLKFPVGMLEANALLIIVLTASKNGSPDPLIDAANFYKKAQGSPSHNAKILDWLNNEHFGTNIKSIAEEYNRVKKESLTKGTNRDEILIELLGCCYKFFNLSITDDEYTNEIYRLFHEKIKGMQDAALYDTLLDVHSTLTIILKQSR